MQTQSREKASSFLRGVAVGAGLMYALDPQRGRQRRGLVRDKVSHTLHEAEELTDTALRDLAHRAHGLWCELRAILAREPVDDDVLAERVHARLGHLVAHPRAIVVEVKGGRVVLSGRVPVDHVERVLAGVAAVRGVHNLESRLETEGGANASGAPRVLKWSPAAKLLATVAGGATVLLAARRL